MQISHVSEWKQKRVQKANNLCPKQIPMQPLVGVVAFQSLVIPTTKG